MFAPKESDLYPQPQTFKVHPDPALADILEGHFRPGFFTGVCTVVMKLFPAVFGTTGGGTAVFGKKDYQQLPGDPHAWCSSWRCRSPSSGPTSPRAEGGLALSSRNGYLSAEQLRASPRPVAPPCTALAQAARQGQQPLPVLEAQATASPQCPGLADRLPDGAPARQPAKPAAAAQLAERPAGGPGRSAPGQHALDRQPGV